MMAVVTEQVWMENIVVHCAYKKYRKSKNTIILNGSFACPKLSSFFLLSSAYIFVIYE